MAFPCEAGANGSAAEPMRRYREVGRWQQKDIGLVTTPVSERKIDSDDS